MEWAGRPRSPKPLFVARSFMRPSTCRRFASNFQESCPTAFSCASRGRSRPARYAERSPRRTSPAAAARKDARLCPVHRLVLRARRSIAGSMPARPRVVSPSRREQTRMERSAPPTAWPSGEARRAESSPPLDGLRAALRSGNAALIEPERELARCTEPRTMNRKNRTNMRPHK
jgi:hypothetical protein